MLCTGSIAFLIYINDMPNTISRGTSLPPFWGDSKCFWLILEGDDGDKLQDNLNKLFDQSRMWGIEFNLQKCKILRIAQKKTVFDKDYFLDGIKSYTCVYWKDLGIWISNDLSWNVHADKMVANGNNMMDVLYWSSKDIDSIQTKKLLYVTWVRSKLEYASIVRSPHTKRNMHALEQLQWKATRFIMYKNLSYYGWLIILNLLPLTYWREIGNLLFLYWCMKGLYSINLCNYISFCIPVKSLRSIDHLTLVIPFSRTEVFKSS